MSNEIFERKKRLGLVTEEEGQSFLSPVGELSRLSLELGHPNLSEQLEERRRRLSGDWDTELGEDRDKRRGCFSLLLPWRWW